MSRFVARSSTYCDARYRQSRSDNTRPIIASRWSFVSPKGDAMRLDRRKWTGLRTPLVIFVLLLAACGALPAGGGGSPEPIKIGALVDLSGPTHEVGRPYSLGEQAYIEWKNAQHGVAGHKLELV